MNIINVVTYSKYVLPFLKEGLHRQLNRATVNNLSVEVSFMSIYCNLIRFYINLINMRFGIILMS